jgi:hypothetical protein
MINRKAVPIPGQMKHLKIDDRGFPIPFVVLVDKEGNHYFSVNDEHKIRECFREKLCHVCGMSLKGEYWFTGGQVSAFHPHGYFVDGPAHKACLVYALQVCPYLAYTQYKADTIEGTLEKFAEKLKGKVDVEGLYNPTKTEARLPFFVLARTKGYTTKPSGPGSQVFKPEQPYREIEYWRDGQKIFRDHARLLLHKNNTPSFLP